MRATSSAANTGRDGSDPCASICGIHRDTPDGDDPFPAQGQGDTTQVHGRNGEDGVKSAGARSKNAETLRRLRAVAIERGLCMECRCRRPEPGKRTCEVCLGRKYEREATYQAAGLCDCGRRPRTGHKQCAKCRRTAARSQKRVRDRKIAAGLCAWHTTSCPAPPMPGKTMCGMHLALAAEAALESTYRRLARGECAACGRPNPTSMWRCPECQRKVNERVRRRREAVGQ